MILECGTVVREISTASLKGMVVVDSSLDYFLQSRGNPADLFSHNVRLLKSSDSSRTALIQLETGRREVGPKEVFVKEFRFKNTLHSLKPVFGQHRAQIAWQTSCHLLTRGVPVPAPEGFLTKKKGPFCLEGYFFSEVLLGCHSLGTLAWTSEELSKRLDAEGLIEALACEIASLHGSGVAHGDLKWSNILIHEKNNELWFVDLDSARIYGCALGPSRVARDLARFVMYGFQAGIDNTVMNRFLDEYARFRKLDRKSLEIPMARVLRKLRKRHKGAREDSIRQVIRTY